MVQVLRVRILRPQAAGLSLARPKKRGSPLRDRSGGGRVRLGGAEGGGGGGGGGGGVRGGNGGSGPGGRGSDGRRPGNMRSRATSGERVSSGGCPTCGGGVCTDDGDAGLGPVTRAGSDGESGDRVSAGSPGEPGGGGGPGGGGMEGLAVAAENPGGARRRFGGGGRRGEPAMALASRRLGRRSWRRGAAGGPVMAAASAAAACAVPAPGGRAHSSGDAGGGEAAWGDGWLQWRCECCTTLNLVSEAVCDRCSTVRGGADATALVELRAAEGELLIVAADDADGMEDGFLLGPDGGPLRGVGAGVGGLSDRRLRELRESSLLGSPAPFLSRSAGAASMASAAVSAPAGSAALPAPACSVRSGGPGLVSLVGGTALAGCACWCPASWVD